MAPVNDLRLQISEAADTEALVAVLHDADEDDAHIRAALSNNALTSYAVYEGEELVGAAVVLWADNEAVGESEIILLAVSPPRRKQGIGRWIVVSLVDEAQRRRVQRLLVGTGSVSLDNIAFYQKCGFRMSHIRRDYFDYIQPPLDVNGMALRDMIVFDYELAEEAPKL